jgi:energy-coupling factor transporter ATP-binding protein EcfA2
VIELRLEGVSFSYPGGLRALDDVNLTIQAGSSVALIGANGSGKTTLLRHLDGLLRPETGRVVVDGSDARARTVAQLAAGVGLCFQYPDQQIFNNQVRSEVEFGAKRMGATDEEAFTRAKEALELVGLTDVLERHPADLGETRRKLLTIASVLAMRTPVVALDEPTTGLDRSGSERIKAIVSQLHDSGRTVVAVSHDLRFVAESFQRVVLLDEGQVRLDGTPMEVFAESAWGTLREAGLEPPESALIGARLGLGSTPTEDTVVVAAVRAAQD